MDDVKITLLDDETEKECGYKATPLSLKSHKPVIFKCNDCGVSAKKPRKEVKGTCRECTVKNGNTKRRATTKAKYGVDFVAQHEDIKKKTADTCYARYNAKAPSLNPDINDKARQTKFGQ